MTQGLKLSVDMDFPGRIHPLLVHLPIGFLVLGYLLELISLMPRYRRVRRSVPFSVLLGCIATLLSVGSGILLAEEGGYEEDLLFRHRLFAFMTAGFSVMLLLLINYEHNLPKARRRPARLAVFSVLILAMTLTGHFGGSMTHGRDYLMGPSLTEAAVLPPQPSATSTFFEGAIRPVLDKKCISCHGASRQKGGLRLDTPEGIRAGGKHGDILTEGTGPAELIRRITLSIEDEDHMPPREKEQLSNLETELIAEWVRTGSSFTRLADSMNASLIDKWKETTNGTVALPWWPGSDIGPADEESIIELRKAGVRVGQLAMGNHHLEVVFTASSSTDPSAWDALERVLPNVVLVRFSFSKVTDQQLARLSKAENLRRLHLDHTAVTNQGIRSLAGLKQLQFLNLVSSGVGPGLMAELNDFGSLKEVYLFGAAVPKEEIKKFADDHPSVRVDAGGYDLPALRSDSVSFLK